jgi:hypothetical protein
MASAARWPKPRATALPLWDVDLRWRCSNDDYEFPMPGPRKAVQQGVEGIACGDLYLVKVREYRERC